MKNIGFIGSGNMAKAMIQGILSNAVVEKENIWASAKTIESLNKVKEDFGINTTLDNREVAEKSDIIFLAVKPYMYETVIREVKDLDNNDSKIWVSIAPGKKSKFFREILGSRAKVIVSMPNTPAMVGAGMTAICPNKNVSEEELKDIIDIMSAFGSVEQIEEKLFEAVVAVSGSSPAYVFMFIEAMADGAVRAGMPRKQAYKFAAQAVLGSAKLLLDTGKHPGELKDMVCSPGGTTIEAVAVLEESGMRAAVIKAEEAVYKRCME